MNTDALLGSILMESIGSSSVVPFVSSVTLEAMKLFGGYALMGMPTLAAFSGIVIGCALNWLLGAALFWIRTKVTFLGNDAFIGAEAFFRRYGWMLCAFYWLPLGSIIVLVTGFFRAPLWKTVVAASIGAALHLWMFVRA
jgi:membrane protein YqaA with SNARE-associated domain